MSMLDHAFRYAALGWPVLPLHHITRGRCSCGSNDCPSQGKHPRTAHGLKEATTDPETIEAWWKRWPYANIGVRTGDTFDALDLDGTEGIRAISEHAAGHSPLPDGPTVATGGHGRHLYFQPTGLGNRAGVLPHVDWRGHGGYVVLPPSNHRSGDKYHWETSPDEPLPAAPAWLLEILNPARPPRRLAAVSNGNGSGGHYGRAALDREIAELGRAPQGMRNHQLNIAAFNLYQLVGGGELDGGHVEDALRNTALGIGLTARETDATISSARQAGLAQPRSAPPRDHDATTGRARPARAATGRPPTTGRLDQAVAAFRRWLHFPDPGALLAALGAAAANVLEGDPVWLLLVGPPGCGKTETIAPLAALDYVHSAAVVSPAALLSGTSKKETERGATGGLLHQVGDFGILLLKDFTSVLAMHRDARGEALAALREIYDGSYDRPVGTGGGRVLSWKGKCGLIAGCTPTIDRHHAVMATMGERFALYRIDIDDPKEQARRRVANRRHEHEMRDELAGAVTTVLEGAADTEPADLTGEEVERIIDWAHFAVWARTGVERDGYNHEVVLMPSREAPARLAGVLSALHAGLSVIGASPEDTWRIIAKLAWDSVPDMRRRVLTTLAPAADTLSTADIVTLTGIPKASAQRTLEDLALLDILDRAKAGLAENAAWQWSLSPTGKDALPTHFVRGKK